jgi:hypothetical protein
MAAHAAAFDCVIDIAVLLVFLELRGKHSVR